LDPSGNRDEELATNQGGMGNNISFFPFQKKNNIST
jgi:hypothetical protein